MEKLIQELRKAHKLSCQYSGGYSESFINAEEFSKALEEAITKLEANDYSVINDLHLWFLPTSDWDDFIGENGLKIGNTCSELLHQYVKTHSQ